MKSLLHHIRIKRLEVESPQQVSAAAADFSKLSYYNEETQKIYNGGNPFLANTVCATPFEKSILLGTGVHLHFILPEALTRFSNDPKEVLEAPNRWLLKRIRKENNKESVDEWVIESDFLSKKKQFSNRSQSTTLVPVDPNAKGHHVYKDQSQPFRYMGRVLKKEAYEASSKDGEYWERFFETPFTAFAYGETHFSSFYPNCQSVFGFYDPEGKTEDEYEIIGWYTSKNTRYLKELKETLSQTESSDIPSFFT